MKKLVVFSAASAIFAAGFSQNQTITLGFTGEDSLTHNSLSLEKVFIHNITAGCDTTIYGAAPSLVLTFPSGINEPWNSAAEPVIIMPPVPNPFDGCTMVTVRLCKAGILNLRLFDPAGRVVAGYNAGMPAGLQRFRIESSASSVFFLNLTMGNWSGTVKLVSTRGGSDGNKITFIRTEGNELKSVSAPAGFSFRLGDQLSFRSAALYYFDKIIYDVPLSDMHYIFSLRMVPAAPVVQTGNLVDMTHNSATVEGEVISDGGQVVTARGFCRGTSPAPRLADPHTFDGSGTGLFLGYITGLDPKTHYYACAYAINCIDTSYGADLEFTTLAAAPVVLSDAVTGITTTSALAGGEVTSGGGDSVTARGFCWAASPNPVIGDPHTSDGTGTGLFESAISGLLPDQTYYGRAYATNSTGTSYGEEIIFSTPGDGFYIRGSATAFSEFNDTALMKMTRNEVIQTDDPDLLELYIPLKAGSGGFSIIRVAGYAMTVYGPGPDFATVLNGGPQEPKVPFQRGSYSEDTANFIVLADGMYHVALYVLTKKVVVVPVHWGMIGSALNGWDESVPMNEPAFDPHTMTWTKDSLELNAGEWKFRYSDGWKVGLDTTVYVAPGIKGVKVNANFGQAVDHLVPGGYNIVNTDPGIYSCTMEYTLGYGYQASLIKTGSLPQTELRRRGIPDQSGRETE